ncbi:MAG: efflux RND transporter periplasmic adaptor subunit [Deferribacteres bacterium]|nr:efflux RND transporter periplasmic adaptor subunit [candidate division KSB1 bacterium]MCB9500700.1 efflux RND transporter periplasmic adaptor subunit [Deferribacteres bacterium]
MTSLIHKKIMFFAILAVGTFFFSCGKENKEQASGEITVPPSLSVEAEKQTTRLIKLTEQQTEQLHIEVLELLRAPLPFLISTPAITYPAPDLLSQVSTPISGRITQLEVQEGKRVKKGDLLCEIESLEFADLAGNFLEAHAEFEYLKSRVDRIGILVQKKISPQSALEKANSDLARARVQRLAAHARLLAIGVRQRQIDTWLAGTIDEPRLLVEAPISGIIMEQLISLGEAVDVNKKLMTIIELDKVLIRGFVSPEEGALIKAGDSLYVAQKDFPESMLPATVTTVNPALDPINKSITVNVITPTPDNWPRPGQNVRFEIKVTTPAPVLAVPATAIEYEGESAVVFVQKDSRTFEKRFIKIGENVGKWAIIHSGLKDGETIAVSQVFSLKALSKFEEFAE